MAVNQQGTASAAEILKWSTSDARKFLGATPEDVRKGFKALVSKWHPDVCDDAQAGAVLAHLMGLRSAALSGKDTGPGELLRFALRSGSGLGVRAVSQWRTDTGSVYVAKRTVGFVFDPDATDLAEAAKRSWAGVRFADDKMRSQFAPMVPAGVAREEALADGGVLLAVARPKGTVALGDLVAFLGGALPSVHMAWVGSRLFNAIAWFQWMGLSHGALHPQNVFVNPETHGLTVLGGWEFATPLGQRPRALPHATLMALPRLEAAGETVDAATDLTLARDLLRFCVGDAGVGVPKVADLPASLAAFIAAPASGSAREELGVWNRALDAAWGARKFQVCPADEGRVYGF